MGILYFQPHSDAIRRICVPADGDLRNVIVFEHHNVTTSGHPNCLKRFFLCKNASTVTNGKDSKAIREHLCDASTHQSVTEKAGRAT